MTGQIPLMPAGHHDNDGASWLQPLTGTGCIPLVNRIEDCRIRRLGFLFTVRVVNDQQISTLTGDSAANADGKILAFLIGVPTACGLAVLTQLHTWESGLKIFSADEVPHLAAKAHRQFSGMSSLNNLP